jgi:hypothetical protein
MKALVTSEISPIIILSSLIVIIGLFITPSFTAFPQDSISGDYSYIIPAVPSLFVVLTMPLLSVMINWKKVKEVLIYGLVLCTLLGIAGQFAKDPYLIMITHLILGLSVATVLNATTVLIQKNTCAKERVIVALRLVIYLELAAAAMFLLFRQTLEYTVILTSLTMAITTIAIRQLKSYKEFSAPDGEVLIKKPVVKEQRLNIFLYSLTASVIFFMIRASF